MHATAKSFIFALQPQFKKNMLSTRATKFLAAQERAAFISDEKRIRALFEKHNVPFSQALLDFHLNFAGYTETYMFDTFVYGLAHEAPKFAPKADLSILPEHTPTRQPLLVSCMDCHPAYGRHLDAEGVYYEDGIAVAANFAIKVERDAFIKEISYRGETYIEWKRVTNKFEDDGDLIDRIQKRFKKYFQKDLSDKFTEVYYAEDVLVKIHNNDVKAWGIKGSSMFAFQELA